MFSSSCSHLRALGVSWSWRLQESPWPWGPVTGHRALRSWIPLQDRVPLGPRKALGGGGRAVAWGWARRKNPQLSFLPWGGPGGSRAWRPKLGTKREEAAGWPCLCSLASAFGGRWTQAGGRPHGKPCWVPTPGMAGGELRATVASGQQAIACRSGVAIGPGCFYLSILVLGYLYLCAVKTQAVGRHSTGLAGLPQAAAPHQAV